MREEEYDEPGCMCDDDDCPTCGRWCTECGGDGYGIVGVDWDPHDYINGPHPGEVELCRNCRGSGLAKDMTYW